jgi:CO/xanthine dehydrogenase Mo-binding subunit
VANALGFRVGVLPITPARVLAAMNQTSSQKAGA